LIPVIFFPVNELSMNFAPERVDHGYLKVLIVAEALVAEVPGNFSRQYSIASACVLNPIPTLSLCGTPSFIVIISAHQSGVSGLVPGGRCRPAIRLEPLPDDWPA
jgi:hypothetical protein